MNRRLIWFAMEPRGRVRHLVIGSGGTPACGREASEHMRYGWHETGSGYEYHLTVLGKPLCKGCQAALDDFLHYVETNGLWS